MSGHFILRPHVLWDGGRYPWRLITPLVYQTRHPAVQAVYPGGVIRVPDGYCTDFASVPRIPGVFAVAGDRAALPAILHDWLYDCGVAHFTRKTADDLFLEAMHAAHDPESPVVRWLMYRAVRLAGGKPWRKNTTHKCNHCEDCTRV